MATRHIIIDVDGTLEGFKSLVTTFEDILDLRTELSQAGIDDFDMEIGGTGVKHGDYGPAWERIEPNST